MNNRSLLWIASTMVIVTGYFFNRSSQDTLPQAANRLGQALVNSNVHEIWNFVPDDERKYYSLNEEKFSAYWNAIVMPQLAGCDSFTLDASSSNGIDVIISKKGISGPSKRFSLLVSGQMGKYYSPFIISTAGIRSSIVRLGTKKIEKYVQFDEYAQWASSNAKLFAMLGIKSFRRGPLFQGETAEDLHRHFQRIADDDFARTQLLGPDVLPNE